MIRFEDLKTQVSEDQGKLLTAIWDHYTEKGQWILRRHLHALFQKLGKAGVQTAFKGLLGGAVVFEAMDNGREVYRLTILGVFLSDRGSEMRQLVARYLGYVRKEFKDDPEITTVAGKDVEAALGLRRQDSQALWDLLLLGGSWLGSAGGNKEGWSASPPRDVEDLLSVTDLEAHICEKAMEDYRSGIPIDEGGRMSQMFTQAGVNVMRPPFSERHGYVAAEAEITIREDAPEGFRSAILDLSTAAGISPQRLRAIVCPALGVLLDRNNWSDSNVWQEVEGLVGSCDWPFAYDIAEKVHGYLCRNHPANAQPFEDDLNRYFRRAGIGWQMVDAEIQVRGTEAFEASIRTVATTLGEAAKSTAAREIHEALRDLSRRPTPDLTGAIQHAMASLECVARDATGNAKATLGDIIKRYPGLLPTPMATAVEKMWGYASEVGRHLREGRTPSWEEAEAVVGLAAVAATYLTRKLKGQ